MVGMRSELTGSIPALNIWTAFVVDAVPRFMGVRLTTGWSKAFWATMQLKNFYNCRVL